MTPEEILTSAGWHKRDSEVLRAGVRGSTVTWWSFDGHEFPQFFALDIERLRWRRFIA